MAVTRSWEQAPASEKASGEPIPWERRRELPLLAAATLLVVWGLAIVYIAKTQSFAGFPSQVAKGELLNLNAPQSADGISPFLLNVSDPSTRAAAASKVAEFLRANRPLPNVGSLAKLRADSVQDRLLPIAKLKPALVVRTPAEFRALYLRWCGIYLAAFWAVHLLWRWRRFRGDPAILPTLLLLTGMGLMLAVSLRDPLRDTLEFQKFAWGCALGCAMLLLPLLRFFQVRNFSTWIYTPLLAALALFAMLLLKGSGPAGSDAKVNLGPFQPVELIKLLLVFFLAGYFARRWEWLRELREKRLVPAWLRWPAVPRLAHVLPVGLGVAVALLLFFVLKDMGPALVVGFLFLSMFAVARGRSGLALFGIALLVGGVALGYRIGAPHTVVDRVNMWLSPWDNDLRGGDQIAHSLWALSTGGPWGSGLGMGDPGMIPAGHTDLVLSAIGEEWGFPGIFCVCALFALLVYRAFTIAREAPDDYATLLAFGLGVLVSLEMLLVSAGVLDAIPLSGVVSPFLSSGNTAMLANFLLFAILLGISNQRRPPAEPVFATPVRVTGLTFAALAILLVGRAAYFQVFAADEFLLHDAKVYAEDGIKRPRHNPRLNSLMRQIPRGDISDRNGVLLATSSWPELEAHRAEYEKLGVSIDNVCSRLESRHYPFGTLTTQFLGDYRTGENFQASNSSLIEHDSNPHLQGYRNLEELAPAVRYRHYPNDWRIRALRNRVRDLKSSLDIRLQMRLDAIVQRRMDAGAAVVLEAGSGDILAMVSAPHQLDKETATPDQMLDRARYGQYPPGSTFKLVTAMAALQMSPHTKDLNFACTRLPDGRAGAMIRGWNRPIRDDVKDHPHGTLNMFRALTVSCNAYFAQLGVFSVGSRTLWQTAANLGLSPGDAASFRRMLPFSSYGQGPVLTTPFKMARVAATIADGGKMPEGRWVLDNSNSRIDPPRTIVSSEAAEFIGEAMRSVVTGGTGRAAMDGLKIPVAGKTGTAQVENGEPHSWFTGFAPYGTDTPRKIAFAVVVEHGGYGARAAAPVARELIEAARDLGIIASQEK